MSEYLPREVREGLQAARMQVRKARSRRSVRVGDQTFVVLRHWDRGFALDGREAPPLRGLVDLYEGERHLCRALVVTTREDGQERVFEYKFANPHAQTAPSVDYVRDERAPVGLLEQS